MDAVRAVPADDVRVSGPVDVVFIAARDGVPCTDAVRGVVVAADDGRDGANDAARDTVDWALPSRDVVFVVFVRDNMLCAAPSWRVAAFAYTATHTNKSAILSFFIYV